MDFHCRCFPLANNESSHVTDPRAEVRCITISQDVIRGCIFPYLNLYELGVCRIISHAWNKSVSDPILWRSTIYREMAFSIKNWGMWDRDFIKDVDERKEILSLPENIAKELRRSAFPGESIRKTHVLVRMPKGLTINKLGELAKKYFPDNIQGYRYIDNEIVNELGDKLAGEDEDELGDEPAGESVWLLMTKDILQESRGGSYRGYRDIVASFSEKTGIPYQVPTLLEAVACILAEYSRSENRLFSDRPKTYIRCQDTSEFMIPIVGNFSLAGLDVEDYSCYYYHDSAHIGVAALRKF